MPIRYPIAFRGTARPSGCSAWRLKVPKIERLTHPKPYIVPKTPCSSETFCLFLPYLFKPKPYIVPKLGAFPKNFCLFQPYLLIPKPYVVPKLGALPKPFDCFSLICSSRNPISCRNSVFFRNLLLVSALFVQAETLVFRGTWRVCASA